jgi:hypothetical protein
MSRSPVAEDVPRPRMSPATIFGSDTIASSSRRNSAPTAMAIGPPAMSISSRVPRASTLMMLDSPVSRNDVPTCDRTAGLLPWPLKR